MNKSIFLSFLLNKFKVFGNGGGASIKILATLKKYFLKIQSNNEAKGIRMNNNTDIAEGFLKKITPIKFSFRKEIG